MSTEILSKPYRLAADEGVADVWWKTGRLTVKVSGSETGQAFSQLVTDDPRGGGTPMHVHRNEDETFFVIEGEVTIVVGGQRVDLVAGDYCFAPRNIPHAYIVRSERARLLTTLSPAGLEELFVDLGVAVAEVAEQPADEVFPPLPELIRRFGVYGIELVGPPLSLDDLS